MLHRTIMCSEYHTHTILQFKTQLMFTRLCCMFVKVFKHCDFRAQMLCLYVLILNMLVWNKLLLVRPIRAGCLTDCRQWDQAAKGVTNLSANTQPTMTPAHYII